MKNNKPGLVEVRLTLVVGGVAIGTVGQPIGLAVLFITVVLHYDGGRLE